MIRCSLAPEVPLRARVLARTPILSRLRVHRQHDASVHGAAEKARDEAEERAEHGADQGGDEADAERDARAREDAAEDIVAEIVRAAQVGRAAACVAHGTVTIDTHIGSRLFPGGYGSMIRRLRYTDAP